MKKYYKDANGNLHYVGDVGLLPTGSVEITDAEAEVIRSAKVTAALSSLTYAQKRAAEYPPMTDYMDAVVKGDVVQQQAYIAACLAVKSRYPKP